MRSIIGKVRATIFGNRASCTTAERNDSLGAVDLFDGYDSTRQTDAPTAPNSSSFITFSKRISLITFSLNCRTEEHFQLNATLMKFHGVLWSSMEFYGVLLRI